MIIRAHSDRDDILVAHQRSTRIESRQGVSSSGNESQIFSRGCADAIAVPGMAKVGVAIDIGQAETAFPPQGEQVAENDAAIAAQHQRKDVIIS